METILKKFENITNDIIKNSKLKHYNAWKLSNGQNVYKNTNIVWKKNEKMENIDKDNLKNNKD